MVNKFSMVNMVEEQVIREAGRQASAAAFKVEAGPHGRGPLPVGAGRLPYSIDPRARR